MDSATPGYASCVVPRDVFSDNGAVVLMERGTRVLGEYRGGLEGGRRRLFVLWTRAVTPTGVAVALASPATDALGRSGFDGEIDTRFWDRFGGALLLSIVDDGVYAAAGRGQESQSSARVPSDAAAIALQNSVAIPPTLHKAQGAEVSIFVAQDLNFADVYRLRPR
ncbi:Type IV secretion system protein virB10 [compost metagenome]